MKKLQKIKLNDASLMSENEMKRVVGSFRTGRSNDCPKGHSELECAYSCEIETVNQYGDPIAVAGECHYQFGLCVCVAG